MINNYRYDYVKQQIDGYDYISKYTRLKKTGLLYKGRCPIHNEKTPSFYVYPKGYKIPNQPKQLYDSFYCFGCGAGGDVISFKEHIDKLDSREEALLILEKEYEIDGEDPTIRKQYLEEQSKNIKESYGRLLDFQEINMIVSCMCKNYLDFVKEYYSNYYEKEQNEMDDYYSYLDDTLLNRNNYEAMLLISEVEDTINKKMQKLKTSK